MTGQPQPPTPSGSEQPSGISVEALGTKVTIWGKNILLILLIATPLYLALQTEVHDKIKKHFYKEEYEQKQKFYLQHKFISPIIDAWDTIHDIEDMSKKSVILVRKDIDDAVLRYENLNVKKLSMAIQITWQYHLARLKIIEADKDSKINSLEVAVKLLVQAKLNSNNPETLTSNDMEFINKNGMNARIKRTLLNAYALSFHITQDKKYSLMASEILKDVSTGK